MNEQQQQEPQTVEVTSFTIGELLPIKGVWFEVTEASSDGREFTIRAMGVTTGYAKKRAREFKKLAGKHFRQQAARDMRAASERNARQMRQAKEHQANINLWLKAEQRYAKEQLLKEFEAASRSAEAPLDDPALD